MSRWIELKLNIVVRIPRRGRESVYQFLSVVLCLSIQRNACQAITENNVTIVELDSPYTLSNL